MAKQQGFYVNDYLRQKLDETVHYNSSGIEVEFNQGTNFRTLQPEHSAQESTNCQGKCYKVFEVFCFDPQVEKELHRTATV